MKALPCLVFTAALLGTAASLAVPTTHYVDAANPSPSAPYTNWLTAATNIQDAVDAADPGDLVLVANGLYQFGGALAGKSLTSNRVAILKPITVQSLNGPAVTTILGSQGNSRLGIPYARCAYLTNGAFLIGFTLTNGTVPFSSGQGGGAYADSSPLSPSTATLWNCVIAGNSAAHGGGAYGLTLNNCLLVANSASVGGAAFACTLNSCTLSNNTAVGSVPLPPSGGGGAYRSTLNNCHIVANIASAEGGGAYASKMTNCLVVANQASQGGGVFGCQSINCTIVSNTASLSAGGLSTDGFATSVLNSIVYFNSAPTAPNYQSGTPLSHCCTTPLSPGPANFTNNPALLDPAAGDFRLTPSSPCINAGLNSAVINSTDLEGDPRIAGGTVDIGAFELQNPASSISYAWLQRYGMLTDGSADALDPDGDRMTNWQEWRAGTNPTNAASLLSISSITVTGLVATLRWQSASDVTYTLERATNLPDQAAFFPARTNISGTGAQITIAHTNSPAASPAFYRLSVP